MNESARDVATDAILKELQRENAALRQDRENLQRLVAERNELLHLTSFALNQVREAAFLLNESGRLVYVNEEACRTLGYSTTELLQMGVADIDPDWIAHRWDEGWSVLREKGSLVVETTHRRKDGVLLPVQVNASHFEYGGKEYNLAIARDMTAHRRTESLLTIQLELEAQFRRLAESTLDVICRYDRQCRLVYANSGLAATLRKPLPDLLGKTPAEHEPDGRYAQYQALLASVIETGMERHVEVMVPDAGSGARHHHIRVIPERGLQDEIVGALALGLDITERKEAEQRLYVSEQAFRAIVEHSPDYIARYDLQADGSPFKLEYFGNPDASAKKSKDGWLHMGDVVHEDENGWLFFEYRKGGGIRHNGEFINPAPIEKVIAESGAVEDVYVYGVKASSGAPGEKDVIAAVVPKRASGFDPQEVFRACRAKLEASSVISFLQVVPEIPKTASEKPLERYLLDMFEQQRDSVFTEIS
jgi:PAS domain S-box-containing protein